MEEETSLKSIIPILFVVVFSSFVSWSASANSPKHPVIPPPMQVTDVAIVDEDIDLEEYLQSKSDFRPKHPLLPVAVVPLASQQVFQGREPSPRLLGPRLSHLKMF
jgi:hypothetical protein